LRRNRHRNIDPIPKGDLAMKHILLTIITQFTTVSAANAQFSAVVYDPTQSVHAIQQIEQGQNIFTNTVKLADNAIATYNLAHQMAMAPETCTGRIFRLLPIGRL
jgi:hypothetical protein